MATNYTEHYELNQWEPTDQVLRTDFNADNAKVDAVLAGLAEDVSGTASQTALDALSSTVAGHTTQLTQKGNCQIYTTSYTGVGEWGADNANQLTFPESPLLVLISCASNAVGISLCHCQMLGMFQNIVIRENTTWSSDGKTLSWYYTHPTDQFNTEGMLYRVVAFMAA